MQRRKNWKLIDSEVVHIGKIFSMKNLFSLYKLLPENNMILTKYVSVYVGGGRRVLNVTS
jgi:hypothetical protein